jgi:hypothetical protein
VLTMLTKGETVTEICHRHGVSATQAYRWRDQFLEGGKKASNDGRTKEGRDAMVEENRKLKELVGGQGLIIEAFFSEYKVEEVYRNEYRNSVEAKAGWELYRNWYETERVHQSLGYQTPHQVWGLQKMAIEKKSIMCIINQTPSCPV